MSLSLSTAAAEGGASSPHLIRRLNAEAILGFAFAHDAFSATELMEVTGLTRSTVLGICSELVKLGWLDELQDARAAGEYSKGRPARRYRLRPDGGAVVAIDAGLHHVTAVVCDLSGRSIARMIREYPSTDAELRRRTTVQTAEQVLDEAGGPRVLLCTVAVPAPVDDASHSPEGDDGFWRRMNPDFADALGHLGPVIVENDANLAAVAERATGLGQGVDSFAVLLSSERFGAGIILDGRLLRGAHGGAGELRLLNMVRKVGSADGLASVARRWAQDAVHAGKVRPGTPLATVDPERISADTVLEAAELGDPVAGRIADRLGDRLARIAEVLASLLDVRLIVVAGGIAPGSQRVVERATTTLARSFYPPLPEIARSALGADIVVLGAVERGLDEIRADPLSFRPASRA